MKHITFYSYLILSGCAYISASNIPTITTTLHKAIEKNDVQTVGQLLNTKENLNTRNRSGDTPLLLAARRGNNHIMQLLLKAGADPNISDNFGLTPLLLAISWGENDIIPILLDVGANPNKPGPDAITPLERAALLNNFEIVQHLLEGGAHPLTEAQLDQLPNATLASLIKKLQKNISRERYKALSAFSEKIIEPGLAEQPGFIPHAKKIIHELADTPIQQRGQEEVQSTRPSSTPKESGNDQPMIFIF